MIFWGSAEIWGVEEQLPCWSPLKYLETLIHSFIFLFVFRPIILIQNRNLNGDDSTVFLLFPSCRFLIDCVQESSDWSSAFYNTGAIVGCLFLVQFSGYAWCFSVPPHCTHLTLTDLKWTLWSHTSYAPLFVFCTIFLVKENLTLQNIWATLWGGNGSGSKMGHLPISSQWTDPLLL